MNISELNNNIKVGKIDSLYLFYGDEWKVQQIYIDAIAKAKNLPVSYVDSVASVYKKILFPNMLTKPELYVIRDDKEVASFVGKNLHKNIVIGLNSSVDKRTKFYQTNKDSFVEFSRLNDDLLIRYIHKEIPLSQQYCKVLIDVCGGNYGQILLEIDKIREFVASENVSTDDAFKILLHSGIIYSPPKDAIFEFVDDVLSGRQKKSFEMLEHCYGVGEATLVMLSVLYTNTKQTLQVQSCTSSDIASSTGLTGWQIKNAKKHCGVWRNGDLVYLMKLIREMEKGIKTGRVEDYRILDYVLVKFYGG